jgi:thioredoxin:protein disulfide reductase
MKACARVVVASIVGVAVALWPLVAFADDGGSDTGAFQRALAHGAIFAVGASYVFGLATSLTPCVYPMVAITVSVFGAREAKTRVQGMLLSLTFVLGIVCLFTPMGEDRASRDFPSPRSWPRSSRPSRGCSWS